MNLSVYEHTDLSSQYNKLIDQADTRIEEIENKKLQIDAYKKWLYLKHEEIKEKLPLIKEGFKKINFEVVKIETENDSYRESIDYTTNGQSIGLGFTLKVIGTRKPLEREFLYSNMTNSQVKAWGERLKKTQEKFKSVTGLRLELNDYTMHKPNATRGNVTI